MVRTFEVRASYRRLPTSGRDGRRWLVACIAGITNRSGLALRRGCIIAAWTPVPLWNVHEPSRKLIPSHPIPSHHTHAPDLR